MQYLAHIRPADSQEQTVAAHCLETAGLAADYGTPAGISETAALAGILHDIGKLTADFNTYIREPNTFRRGELDHSFAGAKYIQAIADRTANKELQKTAALIGRVILSHHGLHDWVTDDADDPYHTRIAKETYYAEITQNLHKAAWLPEIPAALECARAEIMPIRKKLRELSEHNADNGRKKESFAFTSVCWNGCCNPF